MFVKLKPKNLPDDSFSWKLCKNPSNVYEKELDGSRNVKGWFDEDGAYNISILNSTLSFLQIAKKLNLEFYIHSDLAAVCPHSLKLFYEIFRSIIRGNNSTGGHLSDDKFLEKLHWEMVIGPYKDVDNENFITDIFKEININANPIKDDNTTCAFMYKLDTIEEMSLTEFLQKIYLISCYLGYWKNSIYTTDDSQILKFIYLSKNWLYDTTIKNKVIRKLCNNRKNLMDLFNDGILNSEDSEFKKEEKLEEQFITLHTKRHNFVVNKLKELKINSLVDLGSSEGKLIQKISKDEDLRNINILCVEPNEKSINKILKGCNYRKNIRVSQSNILFPNIPEEFLLSDCVTCIELIEHFDSNGRIKLLKLIKEAIVPEYIILTTPNIKYNINYNLDPGKLRRNDHVIEYDQEMFEEEVVKYLSDKYEIEYHNLTDEEMQSTFVITGKYKHAKKEDQEYIENSNGDLVPVVNKKKRKPINSKKPNYKLLKEYRGYHNPIYLPISNYNISEKELNYGYSSKQFTSFNYNNIFYMAPTIAPVEYTEEHPDYIEHPLAAFKYYLDRGIYDLVEEKKYMGSRAYILVFKTKELANKLGYNNSIIINSRKGFPFFNDDSILELLHEDIVKNMDDTMDFVMLDAEILPWTLKADRMVKYDFICPGECVLLSRKYNNLDTKNAEQYLDVLTNYTKDGKIEIRPFHLLSYGKCDGNKFKDVYNGYYKEHFWHLTKLNYLTSNCEYFKPCEWNDVHLRMDKDKIKSIDRWEKYCDSGGEGFVYKAKNYMNHLDSGYYLQPALKVRGKEYLRMVYGIDYIDKDYFNMIKFRKVKTKRIQANQQFEISKNILQCFLNRNLKEMQRNIAAFIGAENINRSTIDATL